MTEREKIIGVIEKWAKRTITTRVWGAGVYDPYNAAELADAFIAAGIGDVKSWEISDADKERSSINYYCEMREWKDKCKEAEHRAEVAEKGLLRACKVNTIFAEPDVPNILAESVLYEFYIRQAEEEIAEGKKDE